MIRVLARALPTTRRLCTAPFLADLQTGTETEPAAEFKSLYRRLSALSGSCGGSVTETMKKWIGEGRRVRESELIIFIREFRKYKSYKIALELMDWMDSQQLLGNNAMRIDLLSKVKGVRVAEEYFNSLPDPAKHHATYGALLCCYCSKKMKNEAMSTYEKMKELGIASSSLVYNNLMSLLMKSGQPEEVLKLFEEMKASNVVPDKCSYKILIENYALLNDVDSVERVIHDMESNDGALHWSVYCHLSAIYNSVKLFEKSRVSLKKAELVINGHDLSPYPFLISLYAGSGDLLEVKRVWGLLKSRIRESRRPTNKEYLIVLQALMKFDDIAAMKDLFKEWETRCVRYDLKLVNTVIRAYLKADMVEEAKFLLEDAMEKVNRPVFQCLWLFADYYLNKGEMNAARGWSRAATSLVKRGPSGELEIE